MPKKSILESLLESLFDETGATKGCDCPGCQHRRAMHEATDKTEPASEPDTEGGLVQTIASLVVNNEIVSVGFTVPEQADYQQRVAVRFSQDDIAEVLTADEARILGHALLAAANHID